MRTRRGALVLLLVLAVAFRVQADDDLETKVARMAKIGFVSSPSFSPDGTRVAFLSNLSGSPQVWIVSSAGGWPDQVTAFDDPVNAVRWSPDGRWLALQVAPGGGLNERIELVRPDGTELRQLLPPSSISNAERRSPGRSFRRSWSGPQICLAMASSWPRRSPVPPRPRTLGGSDGLPRLQTADAQPPCRNRPRSAGPSRARPLQRGRRRAAERLALPAAKRERALPDGVQLSRRPGRPGAAVVQQPGTGPRGRRVCGVPAQRAGILRLRKSVRESRQRGAAGERRERHQGLR